MKSKRMTGKVTALAFSPTFTTGVGWGISIRIPVVCHEAIAMPPSQSLNPFIFASRADRRFVERQNEVRALFSRLHNGESTAIVGDPHIANRRQLDIADEATRREWIAQAFAQKRAGGFSFRPHAVGIFAHRISGARGLEITFTRPMM